MKVPRGDLREHAPEIAEGPSGWHIPRSSLIQESVIRVTSLELDGGNVNAETLVAKAINDRIREGNRLHSGQTPVK